MREKIFFYAFILFCGTCFSQINSGTPNSSQDKSFLPNITPPSPQSFTFTEYGKNAVNEFTGKVNLSVPVYNYKIGNLNLPISLNYSGAGVKVNDASTIVGTNWILNTGGVINRKINDKADENHLITREFINFQQMLTNTQENCQPYSQHFIELALDKDFRDTEIDEWSFNFNGYSGSFYLDENFNPIYIENENELKIEIIGSGSNNLEKLRNTKTFVITTPDGIKYYFGGLECEKTMVFSGHRGISTPENTSFYLYKISDYLDNEIILDYYTDQTALLAYGKSYQITAAGPFTAYFIPYYTVINSVNQISNPKYLKKIKNNKNNEEVLFNINTYDNRNYLASLQNIEIYSDNTTLIKKVELTYEFPNNYSTPNATNNPASRFFLSKVEINKSLLNIAGKYEVYNFEYDNINLMPSRLSPRQDIFGYFNNKNNETTIPKPDYFENSTSVSFGDLNPDFEFAKRGSLTKIKYPTGGYSTFEYEPIMAQKKRFDNYSLNSVGNSITHIPGDNGFSDDPVSFLGVSEDQEIQINIRTGINQVEGEDSGMIYHVYHNCRAELTILDVNTGVITTMSKNLGMNPSSNSYNFNIIKDHQYQFTFKLNFLGNNSPYTQYINAVAEFKIFHGFEAIEGVGVRIKSQKDYSNDNSFSNYKRYYYKNINQLNNPLLGLSELSFMPKFTMTEDPNPDNFLGYFVNVFSESMNMYANKNSFETYQIVTISYGGDNFENGGVEKYFHKEMNEINTKIITTYDGCWDTFDPDHPIECGPPSDIKTGITEVRNHSYTNEVTKLDVLNGKLMAERNFINKNDFIYKNKEVIYDYTFHRKHLNNAVNYVTWNLFPSQTVPLNFCPNDIYTPIHALSGFFKAYYFIETFDTKLNQIITKEYIEPVPLDQNVPYFVSFEEDVDENYPLHDINFKKITTTQTNTYGTLRGLPIETTTTSSDDNVLLKTKYYYPNQTNTLSGIGSTAVIASNTLVNQNRIATPIQVESYRGTDLLSTQRTLYKTMTGTNFVLPDIIQTSKGSNALEDKVLFSEYDAKGNPTIVSLKNGTQTKYFYNALNQVVAKVENYSASLNIPVSPNLSDACAFITQYPQAVISVYNYNASTNQIKSIVAPNCKIMSYEYDALHQLKAIRDNDGNIVQEFEHNYKPQN